MVTRRPKRGNDDDSPTDRGGWRRGYPKDWPTAPAYREFERNRYRVDYDWLVARLTEIAAALDLPRAAHRLAPHLAAVRLERARAAIAAAKRARRAVPPDAVKVVSQTEAQRRHAASSTINDMARRRVRPMNATLEDLAELARRHRLSESDPAEWLRRGGRRPWAETPERATRGDRYDTWGAVAADMMRNMGADDAAMEAMHALIEKQARMDAANRLRQQRRTQPKRTNGTTGVPEADQMPDSGPEDGEDD